MTARERRRATRDAIRAEHAARGITLDSLRLEELAIIREMDQDDRVFPSLAARDLEIMQPRMARWRREAIGQWAIVVVASFLAGAIVGVLFAQSNA